MDLYFLKKSSHHSGNWPNKLGFFVHYLNQQRWLLPEFKYTASSLGWSKNLNLPCKTDSLSWLKQFIKHISSFQCMIQTYFFYPRVYTLVTELISRFVSCWADWFCKPSINTTKHIEYTLKEHPNLLNKKMEQVSPSASQKPWYWWQDTTECLKGSANHIWVFALGAWAESWPGL